MKKPKAGWNYNPNSNIGGDIGRFNRSIWHELAVRGVIYIGRKHPGPFRYSKLSEYLFAWGVADSNGKPIKTETLKRTLKRAEQKQQLADFRKIYKDASDAELLQFDPDLAVNAEQLKAIAAPAEIDFETVAAVRRFLDSH